ncbi:hypothetical protein Tco_0918075 [Tanacetum coccineum]
MFHVSNLKKCYADEPLAVPLDGLHIDDKLHFVEEPVEIMDREIKQLKQSRIPIIKVRWNSRRPIPEEVSPPLHKYRTVVKCRVLSVEDKAHLTGEDCNNLTTPDPYFAATQFGGVTPLVAKQKTDVTRYDCGKLGHYKSDFLLGFIDLMIQKDQDRHHGILEDGGF